MDNASLLHKTQTCLLIHSDDHTNKPRHTLSRTHTRTWNQPSGSKFHFISRFGKEQAGESIHAISSCAEGGLAAMETDAAPLRTDALIQSTGVNTQTHGDGGWKMRLQSVCHTSNAAQFGRRSVEDCWEWKHTRILYLCAVLGLGHSHQELEYGLRLGHQRRDGMDDRCELGVRFNAWNKQREKTLINNAL